MKRDSSSENVNRRQLLAGRETVTARVRLALNLSSDREADNIVNVVIDSIRGQGQTRPAHPFSLTLVLSLYLFGGSSAILLVVLGCGLPAFDTVEVSLALATGAKVFRLTGERNSSGFCPLKLSFVNT